MYTECVSFHERTLEDTKSNQFKFSRNTIVGDSKGKQTLGIVSLMKAKKDAKRHSSPNLGHILGKDSGNLFGSNKVKKKLTTQDIKGMFVFIVSLDKQSFHYVCLIWILLFNLDNAIQHIELKK